MNNSSQTTIVPVQPPWKVRVYDDGDVLGQGASQAILALMRCKPNLLIGLATGSSPTGTYEQLSKTARDQAKAFKQLRVLKIDEWGGLGMKDPGSCEMYLQEKVLGPWGVSADRYCGWNNESKDYLAECGRMAKWLAEHGPLDLVVLGLGVNGHLALNEPAAELQAGPHAAQLAASSAQHGMLNQSPVRPTCGLTLGMADLLGARQVFLLVQGTSKSSAMKRLFQPRISPRFPASLLWLHPKVTLFCDEAASRHIASLSIDETNVRINQ